MSLHETNLTDDNKAHQLAESATNRTAPTKFSKLLTKEQEYELAYRAIDGDIDARNELVSHNYGLVAKIAQEYANGGNSFEDLFQEGCIGLVMAASKFDPSRNGRFSTYAFIWIKKYICRSSVRSGFSTKIPRRIEPYINKVLSFSKSFEVTKGRDPTIEEISESTGVAYDIVCDVLRFSKPVSEFDNALAVSNSNFTHDTSSSESNDVIKSCMKDNLTQILEQTLNDDEKFIIQALYSSEERLTKAELSRRLYKSPAQISRIEKQAFQKIRQHFAKNNIDFRDFF